MKDNKLDRPIEPLHGVKVVDIGDLRVSRGKTRVPTSTCKHLNIVYDEQERRTWCKSCESEVEPFDAFIRLVEYFSEAQDHINRRKQKLEDAEKFKIRSLAAKNIDKAWRRRNMVPICPSCNNGLFPEDFKNRIDLISRDYAKKRRNG